MIGEIVEEGHKILVFSQFVEMLSIIEKIATADMSMNILTDKPR